jgi:hypothetical protein
MFRKNMRVQLNHTTHIIAGQLMEYLKHLKELKWKNRSL